MSSVSSSPSSSSSSKQRVVRFHARWNPTESWELTVSADDSASDILRELQRLTRSKQSDQLCLCIDEENANRAPAFRRLEPDEKVVRAIMMCITTANPTVFVCAKSATPLPFDPTKKLGPGFNSVSVPCFEHTSADEALRRFLLANAAAIANAEQKPELLVVKALFTSSDAADSIKNAAQRLPLAKNALVLHEKRVSEADSWTVRFIVEPVAPKAPAAAPPVATAPAPAKEKKSSSKEHKERHKESAKKKSSKKKAHAAAADDDDDDKTPSESEESSKGAISKAASRRTLQKHADAIKTGEKGASELVAATSVSIGKATRRADAAEAEKLDAVRERLRAQEAELERLRDAPSADEWRRLMDARVQAVELDLGARLAKAQSEADAATAALEAAQVRDRDARRLLDQRSDELAALEAVLEREREAAKRERDDAAALAAAQVATATRDRELLKSQLELERDALQAQVVQLQQRAAKQAVDLNAARAEAAEKEALASQLEAQHSAATKESRNQRLELNDLRAELAQLQALQSAASDNDAAALLAQQLDEQRAAVQRLQAEQRRDQDELAALRQQLAAAPRSSGSSSSNSAVERELQELREELVQSEEQCEKYAKLLAKARKEYDAELQKLQEVDALTARVEAAESEKRRLEQQLRDVDSGSNASATRHLERIDDLRAQLNARTAELEAANDELAHLRTTSEAASDLARERKDELEKLRKETYELQEKLNESLEEQSELTRRFLQSQNMCAEQENSLNEMRSRLAKLIATRRDVAADAGGKAPKSGQKAIDYWRGMYENELSTRSSLESLFAEKASAVFAAENTAATAVARVAELESTVADLRQKLALAKTEQARLADGLVNNSSDASAAMQQLKRERDDFRNKWHRAVARQREQQQQSDDDSGSYSESEEDSEA